MRLTKFISESNDIKYTMEFSKIANSYYPHFMAEYRGQSMKVAIDLSIIEGTFDDEDKYFEVIDWAKGNSELLQSMWGKLIKKKIDHLHTNLRRAV
jgi:hypothetical protein